MQQVAKGDGRKPGNCFKCGKPGHHANECRSKAAHAVAEDTEQQQNPPWSTEQKNHTQEDAKEQEGQIDCIEMNGLYLTALEVVTDSEDEAPPFVDDSVDEFAGAESEDSDDDD